jgi:VCBS repeat-containing protein
MAIAGTYNVEMTTPMGKQTGTVVLQEDGSGIYKTARGDANFKATVSGDKLTWQQTVPSPMGGTLTLTFNVTISGNDLSGTVQLGSFGNAPMKGTKVA